MFYVGKKAITKKFNFSNVIGKEDLPGYIRHYIHEDETILVAYKTERDHATFTDKKVVLFDNYSRFGMRKQIYSISYKSISAVAITFEKTKAEMNIILDNGYHVYLRFADVLPEDKVRLRILYTCINRISSNQEPLKEDIKRLLDNNFKIKNK